MLGASEGGARWGGVIVSWNTSVSEARSRWPRLRRTAKIKAEMAEVNIVMVTVSDDDDEDLFEASKVELRGHVRG